MEDPNTFLAFEWLPDLPEFKGKVRGIGSPSVDFAFKFQDQMGTHLVLGESKYTESFRPVQLLIHRHPSHEALIMKRELQQILPSLCKNPFGWSLLNAKPFAQLARAFLMSESIKNSSEHLESVQLFWIYPRANLDLTDWPILNIGGFDSPFEFWRSLIPQPHFFHTLSWEDMRDDIHGLTSPSLLFWKDQVLNRYNW